MNKGLDEKGEKEGEAAEGRGWWVKLFLSKAEKNRKKNISPCPITPTRIYTHQTIRAL
ncbi:hypothetical protein [Paramixta manurensis]|uniref:hypothetical protein n=1 Tax=Paramixta manurensis TaxID=2740817 RepID=UPI00156B70D9